MEVLTDPRWRFHVEVIVVVAVSVSACISMIVKRVKRRIMEYLRGIDVRDIRIGLSNVHLRMHCRLEILLSKTTSRDRLRSRSR